MTLHCIKFSKLATQPHQPWWQHNIILWPWFLWIITVSSQRIVHTSNATLESLYLLALAATADLSYLPSFLLHSTAFCIFLPYRAYPASSCQPARQLQSLSVEALMRNGHEVADLYLVQLKRLMLVLAACLCNGVCNALAWLTCGWHIATYIHIVGTGKFLVVPIMWGFRLRLTPITLCCWTKEEVSIHCERKI